MIHGFYCIGVQRNGVPRIWCKNLTWCSYHRTNYVLRMHCTWSLFVAPFFPSVRRLACVYLRCYVTVSVFFLLEIRIVRCPMDSMQPHTRTSSSARYSKTWAKFPILNFWSKLKYFPPAMSGWSSHFSPFDSYTFAASANVVGFCT